MRSSLRVFRVSVLAALGLPAFACGGDSESSSGSIRPCTGSTPVAGDPSIEQCDDGSLHRVLPAQCTSSLPRPDACTPTGGGTPECSMDTDCTASPHGHCGVSGQIVSCICQYGCVTDADCGAGSVCVCGTPVGRCVTAECATDADCGGGALCVQTQLQKCGQYGFACQKPGDECSTGADCAAGELCALSEGRRRCLVNDCPVPGRPFFVDDVPRVAALEERGDWLSPGAVEATLLPAAVRELLAAHWARVGQMEHASVAAFARFVLQLMSLGAPAQLVQESQVAMADEIEHARVAFGLSSAYRGSPVGPAALDVSDALGSSDPVDIVRLTFREGCVGESAAAHEARVAAERAVDPALRAVLSRIADDEERHALTAWKLVGWALSVFGEPVQRALESEVTRLAAEADMPAALDEPLASHGVLGEATRLALRAEAVRSVVIPCARTLLDERAERALALSAA